MPFSAFVYDIHVKALRPKLALIYTNVFNRDAKRNVKQSAMLKKCVLKY